MMIRVMYVGKDETYFPTNTPGRLYDSGMAGMKLFCPDMWNNWPYIDADESGGRLVDIHGTFVGQKKLDADYGVIPEGHPAYEEIPPDEEQA